MVLTKGPKKKVYFVVARNPSGSKPYKVTRVVGSTDPNPGARMRKEEVDALIESGCEVVIDQEK